MVTADALHKLLDEQTPEERKEMAQHCPDGQNADENLRENVLSPQLRQAMRSFTEAIHSGEDNVTAIMMMADLDPSKAHEAKDGIEAIIKAFIEKYEKK